MNLEDAARRWHPIAASHDLPFRHVFHGQLLGREFAVWRADDGFINVWENRCLHRGVRLSIGINDGRELKCQYHGWRYANRTAGCTYIPAHPADAPARTICNRTFPGVERHGLIWSSLDPAADTPPDGLPVPERPLVLRGIAVNASADLVAQALRGYRFAPSGAMPDEEAEVEIETEQPFAIALRTRAGTEAGRATFFLHPVDAGRTVIRGLTDLPPGEEAGTLLRRHDLRLQSLRDAVEELARGQPAPEPILPAFAPLPAAMAELPEPETPRGRRAALRAVVAHKWTAAEGIAGITLEPLRGLLPTFQPGAHIDLHLPNGAIRQYSIVNGPGETDGYTIGVKLESDGGGGSRCLHADVREGDVLALSEPRNNFPLRRDAAHTLLIAGGIGITPLLAMAQTLHHQRLDFDLQVFAQSQGHLAFPERLAALGAQVTPHLGLDPAATAAELRRLLADYEPGRHVYICGPGPMLESARAIAADTGWPDEAVHFEYFKNTHEIDTTSSFEIALARSAMTLQVPAGRTILEVLRENGIDLPSSCEQGACGTCVATVIEGEPDHQDVYFNDAEKARGTRILTCVSRAKTARLVLDI